MQGFNSYSAFRLQIRSGSAVVYDSNERTDLVRDEDGNYSWTLDEPIGTYVKTSGNYSWRVYMANAKFKDGIWSDDGTLTVNLNNQQPMNDHGYSSIAAAVKYVGPDCVLGYADTKVASNTDSSKLRGLVRLQAFTTADFAGDPVGESFVRGKREIQNSAHSVSNACIRGLPQNGTYYLRAFIDLNGNGKKDDFESWGAASEPVTLTTDVLTIPTVGIYIEDADTDGDWIPDAYEFVQAGWSKSWDVAKTVLDGTIIGDDTIRFSANVDTAGVSTGLSGASLTMFQNNDKLGGAFIAVTLGLSDSTETLAKIREAVAKKVRPDTVKITAVTLASNGKKVTLSVAAEVTDSIAGQLLGKVYNLTDLTKQTATVTVKVYKKATLAEAGWTLVCTTQAEVGKDDALVDVPVTGVDMKSGFYKIEIEQ